MAKRTAKQTRTAKPYTTTAETIDREQASDCLRKRKLGQKPTRQEVAALRRVEQRQDDESRWRHYDSIPKRHWAEMSGRSRQIIIDHAKRHGFPTADRTISLPNFLRYLYDWLAKNSRKLHAPETEDEMLIGSGNANSPALERFRSIKADLAAHELREKEGDVIDSGKIRQAHGQMASVLRSASDSLQKQFGPEAHRILDDALEESLRIGEGIFDTDGKAAQD